MEKMKIKIDVPYEVEFWLKQLPGNSKEYKNCIFYINDENINECDFWFVFDTIGREREMLCPPENLILITGEPEEVKDYHKDYVKQFSTIITPQKSIKHKNKISTQLLPWFIDKSYDAIKNATIEKSKNISIICSNKSFTSGHKRRLEFVEKLKEHFKDEIDIYGKGFNEIDNKWDAIAPYRYHIVLENSIADDYWTEKLMDAYLGQSYPIYWGCPNINNYFNSKSYSIIDITNSDQSINRIKNIIESDLFSNHLSYIKEAQLLVLDQYNIFYWIDEYVKSNMNYSKKKKIKLKSEWHYHKWELMWNDLKKRPFKYPMQLLTEKIFS